MNKWLRKVKQYGISQSSHFVIVNLSKHFTYWSSSDDPNDTVWVYDWENANKYTRLERLTVDLPPDGQWFYIHIKED